MTNERVIVGKHAPSTGVVPAIALINPKYPHNLGMVIRLASCYGVKQVWFTGDRARIVSDHKRRISREERTKDYQDVQLIQFDYPLERFANVSPVAVEVRDTSESLTIFEHPENAVYIFGPEDGSIPASVRRMCHRFVVIPTKHCLNLATAVATILWDRKLKRYQLGLPSECEGFGTEASYIDTDPGAMAIYDGRSVG